MTNPPLNARCMLRKHPGSCLTHSPRQVTEMTPPPLYKRHGRIQAAQEPAQGRHGERLLKTFLSSQCNKIQAKA